MSRQKPKQRLMAINCLKGLCRVMICLHVIIAGIMLLLLLFAAVTMIVKGVLSFEAAFAGSMMNAGLIVGVLYLALPWLAIFVFADLAEDIKVAREAGVHRHQELLERLEKCEDRGYDVCDRLEVLANGSRRRCDGVGDSNMP